MRVSRMFKWLVGTAAASVLALVLAPALVTAAGPSTGYLEVCKASDGSAVSGTFRFTVAAQTIEVPVGACSAPLEVAAGVVTVTEEAVAGVGVVDITISPADRAVSASIPSRSAQVTVVAGGVATQSIVTFINRSETGVLTVCKVAGPGIAAGTNFTFLAGGRAIAVPAGQCAAAGSFPHGSNVTIAEVLEPGIRVSEISVIPDRMVGNPSLTDGLVTVAIGPGVTQASFTNETVPQGLLQICKRSDASNVTGTFTFVVAGQQVDVPVGSCSRILRVPEGIVTVSEVARDDAAVTSVSTAPTSRLVSSDLPGRSAQVQIVAGDFTQMATVTFTNQLQAGQVKVCKVAGSGVTLGAPFAFTVAGQALSVPAGSCVLAGTFPLNQRVTVAETVPGGMQVAAIRVEPPERITGVLDVASGSVTVLAGRGVTEVTVTNQSAPAATTTTVPVTTSIPLLGPVPTTTTVPASSTTVPMSTSTTIRSIAPSSTLPPVTTTTTASGLLATTSTTAPVATTTTSAPGLLATTSTTAPFATTTTTGGALSATTSTSTSVMGTTSTSPGDRGTTSTTTGSFAVTSTTAVPSGTSTTLMSGNVTQTTLGSSSATTTTVAACVPTTTPSVPMSSVSSILPLPATTPAATPSGAPLPTSATAVPMAGPADLCLQSSALSTPTTIVERLVERASVPLAAARLAVTGASTSLLAAVALVLVLLGLTILRLTQEFDGDHCGDRRLGAELSPAVGPSGRTDVSGQAARRQARRPREPGHVLRR